MRGGAGRRRPGIAVRRPCRSLPPQPLRRVAHPQPPRRRAGDDRVVGHVLRDDGVRPHDAVVADRDAAQDARAVADPAVVADVRRRACRSPAGGSGARPRRRRGRSRSASRGRRRCTRGRSTTCWKAEIVHSWPSTVFAPIDASPSWTRIFVPWPIQRPAAEPERRAAADLERHARGRRSRGRRSAAARASAACSHAQRSASRAYLRVEHPVAAREAQQRERPAVRRHRRAADEQRPRVAR